MPLVYIMRNLFYLLAFLLVFEAQAQSTETRNLSSFNSISVNEAINVTLVKGEEEQAIVEIKGTDLSNVLTEVFDERLKIHMRKGNWRGTKVNIKVTYKYLEKIRVSSASNLVMNGVLEAKKLEIEVTSAGDAELQVDVEELEIEVSSAGDLLVSGKAKEQYVRVSSSGDYKAFDLQSQYAKVEASSSGNANIFVEDKLEANASSAGDVRYQGSPDKVFVNSSSGGSVKRH